MSPSQGATKWYPYSPNRRKGNDSSMCPLHFPSVHLMDNSKIREIISNFWQELRDSPEGSLHVSGGCLCLGSKVGDGRG